MDELYITSKELCDTLGISTGELVEIQQFFDSDPNDEWELLKGKDYKIVVQASGLREYTQSGAYTIARYLEATRKPGFWELLTEWFLHTKRDIGRSFVKKKILDNCSSLIKRNESFFISKADVVKIFGTKPDYLVRMTAKAQRSKFPLIKGQDYDDLVNEGGLYFSISGIYKLAQVFEQHQTKRNRKEWCRDVGEVIEPQIETVVKQIKDRYKSVEKTKENVRKRDKDTCRVTGKKKDSINKLDLAVHHLYSCNEYPLLVAIENNLITLTKEVHRQFHEEFMGGSDKPCTIDDFIRFLQRYYHRASAHAAPDGVNRITDLIGWLEEQKRVFGNPKPTRKRHVLELPKSRVS